MVTENTWAYLAGIIDGEGCIRIANAWKGRAPTSVILVITNNNPILVEWLVNEFGGKVYHKNRQPPCWDVHWSCEKARVILEGVLPYLIVKKEQAELALSFKRLLGTQGKKVTAKNLDERTALIEVLSNLKRRKT